MKDNKCPKCGEEIKFEVTIVPFFVTVAIVCAIILVICLGIKGLLIGGLMVFVSLILQSIYCKETIIIKCKNCGNVGKYK